MGYRAIESLKVGDMVQTLDRGPKAIRWIGRSTVLQLGKMAPICIAKGALGSGLPRIDLRVSQQHRMMLRSKISKMLLAIKTH